MNKSLFLLAAAIGCVSSSVIPVGVTVGLSPYAHPIQSLYHSQDNYGQYVYGYSTPTSTKSESKTADGVTQGGYSYIDSNGILQTVHYVADPVHGFRVAATNLPQDLPDVALAKAKHLADFAAISAEHASARVAYSNPVIVPAAAVPNLPLLPKPVEDLPEVVRARAEHLAVLNSAYAAHAAGVHAPQVVQDLPEVARARAEHLATVESIKQRDAVIRAQAISLSPIPDTIEGAVVPVRTAQVAPPLPVAPTTHISYAPALAQIPIASQHHAQDNWGQYSYGYVSPLSSKSETRTADGVTRGGYSYIDANGVLQTVSYIADAVYGFRVAATNLPVADHAAPPLIKSAPLIAKPAPVSTLYSQELVY